MTAIEEASAAQIAALIPKTNIDRITHDLARQAASYFQKDLFHSAAIEAAKLAASTPHLQSVIGPTVSQIDKAIKDAILDPTSRLNKSVSDVVSAINQPALEATRRWLGTLDSMGMRGQRIHRSLDIDVSPLESSDSENDDTIKVEVVLRGDLDEEDDDKTSEDAEESDATVEDGPYEFNNYPFAVTLVHNRHSSEPYETIHRLHKPQPYEWQTWGAEIEFTRRYWSPEQIAEHNANKNDDEEDATVIFNEFYSEWKTNENLYDRIIFEIAGIRLNEQDDYPLEQFRQLPPETIGELRFEIKNAVIRRFYESYCWRRKGNGLGESETLVRQELSIGSRSYRVDHVLRRATGEESLSFRTQIIKGYKSLDEDGEEIIVLRLNLQAADELYDKLIIRILNATVDGKSFAAETRGDFLREISPVHKLRVLEPHLGLNAWYFQIDDLVLP
jgi:hypothetical protein